MNNSEKNLQRTLDLLTNFVGSDKIVKYVKKVPNFNDEPKINYIIASYKGSEERSGAVSRSLEIALIKAIAEGVERHCNFGFKKNDIISAFSKIKHIALDPRLLSPFSEEQLKSPLYKHFKMDESTVFGWVWGFCLTKIKKVYLPSQEVYLNYKFLPKESIIRYPVSTGAAGGLSIDSAIVNGICEVIERDAIMISYLDMLPIPQIDIKSCTKYIQELVETFEKYFLEVKVFDVTTDIGIPSALAIIFDRGENKICPVTFGSKCSFDAENAIVGAISEAQNGRIYTRELILRRIRRPKKYIEIQKFDQRSILWTDETLLSTINFYLEGKKINFSKFNRYKKRNISLKEKLQILLNILRSKGYDVFYKDITSPDVRKKGYYVIKSIIPKLHPLYFDEMFPYNYSERLKLAPRLMGYNGNFTGYALNKVPHPFL